MSKILRTSAFLSALLLVSGFTECYKPVTRSQLPPHIKTVAVPAFQNNALRFKIEHRFTEAVMKELIHRGHGLRALHRGGTGVIRGKCESKIAVEPDEKLTKIATARRDRFPGTCRIRDAKFTRRRRRELHQAPSAALPV